ncbi:molybdopterin-dependent oxidoreductase [Haloglomus litoreum]|uniref:molybdopterin-dependent oxidoreductase n=1 Tax=Haloglomus litoreum TaxID=3034026 RepID=UPI0023E8CE46|nr:molybdopterin-dependent oxidoreductase [Haloglomus sp. DT116]
MTTTDRGRRPDRTGRAGTTGDAGGGDTREGRAGTDPARRAGTDYRLLVADRDGSTTRLDYRRLLGQRFESRSCEYRCGSGDRWGGWWRGVPVGRLLDLADVDGTATHLVVASGGGDYTACVPLRVALDGVLALERDGDRLPLGERAPRLVAPDLDSIRTVKGVERVRAVRLAPDEDRDERESFAGRLD